MKRFQRLAGILLIVVGIGLLAYPKLSAAHYDRQQAELLETQLEMLREIAVIEDDGDLNVEAALEPVLQEGSVSDSEPDRSGLDTANEAESTAPATSLSREERNAQITNSWPVESILSIPKINLLMPVISDASLAHLDVSASSIVGTGTPWDGGNYAIAGHRSRSYGRHFNRLDELEIGDAIEVTDLQGRIYTYTVYEKMVVEETDLDVLADEGYDEVTLITCHPITEQHPTTRLIVKAHIEETP